MNRQAAVQNRVESSKLKSSKRCGLPGHMSRIILHPVALMATALTVSLSIASIATLEMIRVDPSPRSASTTLASPGTLLTDQPTDRRREPRTPRTKNRTNTRTNTKDSLPIFSLGAVAISCAAGSFLLCRCLRPQKPDRRMQFSSQTRQAKRSLEGQSLLCSSITATSSKHNSSSQELTQNQAQATSVAATIVPANEDHPLDWSESSIADNLDLRQKRPLSYWL